MSNQQTAAEVLAAALDVKGAMAAHEQAITRLERAARPLPQSVIDEVTTLLDLDEQLEAQRRILAWLEESDNVRD
jgi:hypothetical protein